MTRKEQILELLKNRSPLTPKEIAGELDISANQVRGLLREMRMSGDVESPSHGQYRLAMSPGSLLAYSGDVPLVDAKTMELKLQHYQAFIQSTPYCIAMFDRQARFILATKAYIDQFKIQEHVPLTGKKISEVFTNKDSLDYEKSLLEGKPSTRLDAQLYTPNGLPFWGIWRSRPWFINGTRQVGGWLALCSFAKNKDQIEPLADVAYDDNGLPVFAFTILEDDDVGEKPHIERGKKVDSKVSAELVNLGDASTTIPGHIVDAIMSLIDFEVLDMIFDRYVGTSTEPVEALNISVLRSHEEKPYSIRLKVEVSPLGKEEAPKKSKGLDENGWKSSDNE